MLDGAYKVVKIEHVKLGRFPIVERSHEDIHDK
jgi:hypothetical protein